MIENNILTEKHQGYEYEHCYSYIWNAMEESTNATGGLYGRDSQQLLSNNTEAYENTIPSMLSDRLRNPKFAGPENLQTGVAAEWEPVGNTMTGMSCRLIPGMYMSGREAQLVHNYTRYGRSLFSDHCPRGQPHHHRPGPLAAGGADIRQPGTARCI